MFLFWPVELFIPLVQLLQLNQEPSLVVFGIVLVKRISYNNVFFNFEDEPLVIYYWPPSMNIVMWNTIWSLHRVFILKLTLFFYFYFVFVVRFGVDAASIKNRLGAYLQQSIILWKWKKWLLSATNNVILPWYKSLWRLKECRHLMFCCCLLFL